MGRPNSSWVGAGVVVFNNNCVVELALSIVSATNVVAPGVVSATAAATVVSTPCPSWGKFKNIMSNRIIEAPENNCSERCFGRTTQGRCCCIKLHHMLFLHEGWPCSFTLVATVRHNCLKLLVCGTPMQKKNTGWGRLSYPPPEIGKTAFLDRLHSYKLELDLDPKSNMFFFFLFCFFCFCFL